MSPFVRTFLALTGVLVLALAGVAWAEEASEEGQPPAVGSAPPEEQKDSDGGKPAEEGEEAEEAEKAEE